MPTPSSDQSRDPTSPPPYSFPTCPDDQPYAWLAPEAPREGLDEIELLHQRSAALAATSPETSSTPSHDRPDAHDAMTLEGQANLEPPSRSRTISLEPSASARTMPLSPLSTEQSADEPLKNQASDQCLESSPDSSTILSTSQMLTPTSVELGDSARDSMDVDGFGAPYRRDDPVNLRNIPISPSSFLRAGSKFRGTQRSEKQEYEVQVEIKHVDMRESFLCGYLRIQGLTEDHPTLTTYFEGEIIGSKYNFYTQHEDWGANVNVDLSHWSQFSPFRPFFKLARKGPVFIPDNAQKEHVFMRWKEHFLVPDHRVRTISGASFEGFYYICFNQLKGKVKGIYFHSKSEKFQKLELKHVPDRGCFTAMEFR